MVMFVKHWKLTLFCLASIPLLLPATYWFKRSIKIAFQQVRKQVTALNTFVQEHLVGRGVVFQLFNRQAIEFEKFKAINEAHKSPYSVHSVLFYFLSWGRDFIGSINWSSDLVGRHRSSKRGYHNFRRIDCFYTVHTHALSPHSSVGRSL